MDNGSFIVLVLTVGVGAFLVGFLVDPITRRRRRQTPHRVRSPFTNQAHPIVDHETELLAAVDSQDPDDPESVAFGSDLPQRAPRGRVDRVRIQEDQYDR